MAVQAPVAVQAAGVILTDLVHVHEHLHNAQAHCLLQALWRLLQRERGAAEGLLRPDRQSPGQSG